MQQPRPGPQQVGAGAREGVVHEHAHDRGEGRVLAALEGARDEVVALVEDRFLDRERGAAWAERHAGYGAGVAPGAPFVALTRALLAELATSHTGYYASDDPEHAGLLAVFGEGLGLDVAPVEHIGADVDRNGNPSPLTRLACIETAGTRQLPAPVGLAVELFEMNSGSVFERSCPCPGTCLVSSSLPSGVTSRGSLFRSKLAPASRRQRMFDNEQSPQYTPSAKSRLRTVRSTYGE